MNDTHVSTRLAGRPIEDYSGIIFSRIFYDNNLSIVHVMSMAEALKQRRIDLLKIMTLTEEAKRMLEQINGRR